MSPAEGQMPQGPITVAALNADPPDESTHLHVSLMSVVDGVAMAPPKSADPMHLKTVLQTAERLNTKTLTFLPGPAFDSGLVWEGRGDYRFFLPEDVANKSPSECYPQGDGDRIFRRFIEDSVELLSALDVQNQRQDKELLPLNLLWPWGAGLRQSVPDLFQRNRYFYPTVVSDDPRFLALARLGKWKKRADESIGNRLQLKWDKISRAIQDESAIVHIQAFKQLAGKDTKDEFLWLVRQADEKLIPVLRTKAEIEGDEIWLFMSNTRGNGLALSWPTEGSPLGELQQEFLSDREIKAFNNWELLPYAIQQFQMKSDN